VLDWYRNNSPRFSLSGLPDASLTCRHFGIYRSMFYCWKSPFDSKRLVSLENKSHHPKKKRRPGYSSELVSKVRELRKAEATYSGKKLRPILLRMMAQQEVPSIATLGRLIQRNNLFFRPDSIKLRRKRSRGAKTAHRIRKPTGLNASGPGRVVEFDMKHVYLVGSKLYAFCAIDVFTREAAVHIATSPSSRNAVTCSRMVVQRFGKGVAFVNDNGSENIGEVQAYLSSQGVRQYWTHPRSPKEKPFVERFIGTL